MPKFGTYPGGSGLTGAEVLLAVQSGASVKLTPDQFKQLIKNPRYLTVSATAVAGDFISADTTGGAITITLPITPTANQLVSVYDFGGNAATENITIGRNGETIDGLAEDFIIDENYGRVDLIYDGADWKISIVTPGAGLTEAQVDERIGEIGKGLTPVFKSTNYTAGDRELVFVDSSAGPVTITLPITPSDTNRVCVVDATGFAAINNIIIGRNGETINGEASDFTIDQNFGQFDGAYETATTDWKHALTGGVLVAADVTGKQRHQFYARTMGVFGGSSLSTCYGGRFDCISLGPTSFPQAKIPFKFPKRWDGGPVRWRAIYVPSTTNTGDAEYVFLADSIASGEDMAFETTITNTITETQSGVIDRLKIGEWTNFLQPGGSPDDNHYVLMRMQRQGDTGGDTFTGDMDVIAIEMEYTTNSPTDD